MVMHNCWPWPGSTQGCEPGRWKPPAATAPAFTDNRPPPVSWSWNWTARNAPARRAGTKSDPIDAERAARDALARAQLAQPKTGPERAALQMRLTVRRAAVERATTAQRQLHALIVTAPETVRSRFRGQNTRAMISTAARLRPTPVSGDVEIITALTVLRDLARRIRTLETEAAAHETAILTIVRSWRPDLLTLTSVGPIVAATVLTA
ncbi:hypothetical protein [Micromonospora endophytica]|uniref:hypothetical protein n=1 Tax=Micromonospora endophytica TaxID=515350 RepID=UPI001BB3D65B|nr:hypothetical protein [Micromonospora endophytica]BCJ62924.1 hypothetical protein Jiend_63460 [Micromonospora endophytica]